MNALCDKCGQPVPEDNSVALYEITRHLSAAAALARADRHLYPIEGQCEGSPSRIECLKRDGMAGWRYSKPLVMSAQLTSLTSYEEHVLKMLDLSTP